MKEKFLFYNEKLLPTNMKETIKEIAPSGVNYEIHFYPCTNLRSYRFDNACGIKRLWTEYVHSTNTAVITVPLLNLVSIVSRDTFLYKNPGYNLWYMLLHNILAGMYYSVLSSSSVEIFLGRGSTLLSSSNERIYGDSYLSDITTSNHIKVLSSFKAKKTIDEYSLKNSRIGQPHKYLDGILGMYLIKYLFRDKDRRNCDKIARFNNIRSYKCGGQVPLPQLFLEVNNINQDISKHVILKTALSMGIDRHAIDRAGRRHYIFTHGEAYRVRKKIADDFMSGLIKTKKRKVSML